MFAFDRSRRFRRLAASAAIALAASFGLSGSAARAGTSTVDFSSTPSLKGLAGFKGSATLDGDLLTVSVTNTSAASSKGLLYGLAFDDEEVKAVFQKNDGKHGFKSVAGKHGLLIKPFGRYDDALRVAGNKNAIAAGATRTFLFKVSGEPTDATAFDLLNNPKGASVVALFRGFRHGKQDKAGAAVALRLSPADLNGPTNTPGGLSPAGNTGQVAGADFSLLPPKLSETGSKPGTPGAPGSLPGTGGLTDGGSGTAPAAIPLPPAAWTGLGTLAVLGCAKLKRRGLKSFT